MVPVGLLLLLSLPKVLPSSAMSTPGLSPEQTPANIQLAANKVISEKEKKKKLKNSLLDNGCTYLFLEPKMKRKEKHL